MNRTASVNKTGVNTKIMMVRSNKPEVLKIVDDPNKHITQDELDY